MSSDLRDVFKRDLNEIPVPPADEWVRPVKHRQRRAVPHVVRWAVTAIVILTIVVASLGAGQLLVAIRERLAGVPSSATSGLPAFRAGDDYVYVGEADLARGGVQVVEMPAGSLARRLVGRGVVGSHIDRYATRAGPDTVLLQTFRDSGFADGVAETFLEAVVLHSDVPAFGIVAGAVATTPSAPPGAVRIAGFHVGEAALSVDGRRAYLVRDEGPTGAVTRLTVYDAQYDPATNAPASTNGKILATRTWSGPNASWDRTWARIVPLDASRVALVRQRVAGPDLLGRATRLGQAWYFLDADLKEISTFEVAPGLTCSFDLIRVPNDEWAMICGDWSGGAQTWSVGFLRGNDFHIVADVAVARELGFPLGGTVAPDGMLRIITNRPAVVSIDTRTHELVGKRPVTEGHSFLDGFAPAVAAAKDNGSPTVQFSPDGRFAYLLADRSLWWGGIALIDLEKATVVTHTTAVGDASALRLSANGDRLYALVVVPQQELSVLVLLDPGTLKEVARSVALSNGPLTIITVAGER